MNHITSISRRALRANVPLSVQLEITGRCNLDCEHCYLDIQRPPPEMSTDEIFGILEQLASAGTLFLTVTGGEVFLRKDLIPILKKARELGFALRVFTSGTRLTWATAREIAKLDLVGVEMSLYGARCDVHDAITRRPGSHRKTIRAALMLKRLGVKVVLKAPLLSKLEGHHNEFMALATRVGASAKMDPSVMPRRDGELSPTHLRASSEALARAFRDLNVLKEGDPLPPPAHPDNAPCAVARRTARVGPDGKVYPCATYPDAVGSLREKSFKDIWWGDSPLLARLRAFTSGSVGGACGSCAKSGYCSRCLALALIEHGDENAPVADACRVAHAKDLAVGNGAPPPPGLLGQGGSKQRRSLPIVA